MADHVEKRGETIIYKDEDAEPQRLVFVKTSDLADFVKVGESYVSTSPQRLTKMREVVAKAQSDNSDPAQDVVLGEFRKNKGRYRVLKGTKRGRGRFTLKVVED